MTHYVFAITSGGYAGTRKNNGRMYESRPTAADDLTSARVFNTKGAATNAGRALGVAGEAVEVSLFLKTESCTPDGEAYAAAGQRALKALAGVR